MPLAAATVATLRRPRLRRWRRRLLIVVALLTAYRLAHHVIPHAPLRTRYPGSLAVRDAHGKLLRLTLAGDERFRLWTPLDRIAPALVEATLLYEDRHFRANLAANPVALLRASVATSTGGRRIGGSTVTMQLARRLYGIRSKSVRGKLWQIACALGLELVYSKDEILEAYLNLVSYGGNVEGVGAASLIYFGKPPAELTVAEALTLAVIPQSPTQRAPRSEGQRAASDLAPLRAARARLLDRWMERHPDGRRELLEPLPVLRPPGALPHLAPHLVDAMVAELGQRPPESEVRTTLDLKLQRIVERHTSAYVARARRVGIKNAAVLLVDARSMEVKALLGSADFRSDEIAGQVNGTQARRSPGSALKPFVYALGLEQGIIHPRTMLKDAPMAFGAYAPENFDGRYVGPISAQDALIRSRNLPALAVAAKLNRPSFYEFLKTAGVGRLKPERHYGLALVLGGAEVTMEEVVQLYAALANRGVLRPLRYRQDEPEEAGTRVLSEEASYITLEMLRENPRPDATAGVRTVDDRLPVAWKTGTSWGFRDAWTVGAFGPYVMAVWVGDFSGAGNPAYVGVQAAAPLFFEIVDSLHAEQPDLAAPPWPRPPAISRVEVCAVSGQLPSASCPRKVATSFLPGRSPIDLCAIHRPLLVDNATGRQTCAPYARVGVDAHEEVYEFWPSDMLKLFAQAGLPRRSPPESDPRCGLAPSARTAAPQITSPLRGVTYTVQPGRSSDAIALQAVTDAAAREVYWFVDQSFVGRVRAGTPLLWTPRPGRYQVRAVDDLGLADARPLRVEGAP